MAPPSSANRTARRSRSTNASRALRRFLLEHSEHAGVVGDALRLVRAQFVDPELDRDRRRVGVQLDSAQRGQADGGEAVLRRAGDRRALERADVNGRPPGDGHGDQRTGDREENRAQPPQRCCTLGPPECHHNGPSHDVQFGNRTVARTTARMQEGGGRTDHSRGSDIGPSLLATSAEQPVGLRARAPPILVTDHQHMDGTRRGDRIRRDLEDAADVDQSSYEIDAG